MNFENEFRYLGDFVIDGELMSGELIYNRKKGHIILSVAKSLDDKGPISKHYSKLDVIKGKTITGQEVLLINNVCIRNQTNIPTSRKIAFSSEYAVWVPSEKNDLKYNVLSCVLQNALAWSTFQSINYKNGKIEFVKNNNFKKIKLFGCDIIFSIQMSDSLSSIPIKEESKIIQRVTMTIETKQRKELSELIEIRDKIIQIISFGSKNNINIEEESLYDYDYENPNLYPRTVPNYLFSAIPYYEEYNTNVDMNFRLDQIDCIEKGADNIVKMEPVLSLYSLLLRYPDMPIEIKFLNMVQALETFHSRFFYEDSIANYKKCVEEKTNGYVSRKIVTSLLLGEDSAKDTFISLRSRINDLLFDDGNILFYSLFLKDYGKTIADTRNYYTHYNQKKEKDALKDDDLFEAIIILRLLLEYNVCKILGVDITDTVKKELSRISMIKRINSSQ